MKKLGDILIFIGLSIWGLLFSLMAVTWLTTVLFSCSGSVATAVVCTHGGAGLETLLATLSGIIFLSSFWMLYITAPFFLIGIGLKYLTKKLKPDIVDETSKLESYNFSIGKRLAQVFFIVLALLFWWATVLIVIYLMVKNKSVKVGLSKFWNALTG